MANSVCYLIIYVTVLLNIVKCSNFIKDNVTLTIEQGTLHGKNSLDYWNGSYYSFEGIPYAKPPIGDLRFKTSEPAEPWTGVYDATQVRSICSQISSPSFEFDANKNLEQSEDCLFLSVHTKMSTELKPVMVWIHGGGMEFGSIFESTYGPELLMAEDIVLVKVAYRLTIFGFLSIEDPKYNISGNAGLKDQVLALKWIQKNIHHFGGNPNQVTIFGESAGGASVHLLYLSPLAKGLFHRAIAQSGSADTPWLTSPNKYPELAKALKCNSENLDEIVKCINSTTTDGLIDAYKIIAEDKELNEKLRIGEVVKFNSFTIEKEHSDCFLSQHPEDIAKSGNFNKVPIIMGYATHEGYLCINPFELSPNFTDSRMLIPKDIKVNFESQKARNLGKRIQQFYYGNQTPSYELLGPLINYLTDVYILEKVYKYAKLQSIVAKAPVYFYNFDCHTKLNAFYPSPDRIVTHFDDVLYLFNIINRTQENMDPNSAEYIGMYRMVKLWTAFAKSKNADPNPPNDDGMFNAKWSPITADKFNFFKISNNLESKENPAEDRMKFWEEIYGEFNNNNKIEFNSINRYFYSWQKPFYVTRSRRIIP